MSQYLYCLGQNGLASSLMPDWVQVDEPTQAALEDAFQLRGDIWFRPVVDRSGFEVFLDSLAELKIGCDLLPELERLAGTVSAIALVEGQIDSDFKVCVTVAEFTADILRHMKPSEGEYAHVGFMRTSEECQPVSPTSCRGLGYPGVDDSRR